MTAARRLEQNFANSLSLIVMRTHYFCSLLHHTLVGSQRVRCSGANSHLRLHVRDRHMEKDGLPKGGQSRQIIKPGPSTSSSLLRFSQSHSVSTWGMHACAYTTCAFPTWRRCGLIYYQSRGYILEALSSFDLVQHLLLKVSFPA